MIKLWKDPDHTVDTKQARKVPFSLNFHCFCLQLCFLVYIDGHAIQLK